MFQLSSASTRSLSMSSRTYSLLLIQLVKLLMNLASLARKRFIILLLRICQHLAILGTKLVKYHAYIYIYIYICTNATDILLNMYIKKWKVIKFSIIYNIQHKGLIPLQLSQSVVNLFRGCKDSV